ncbi:MAG: HEAT repeat domain-containing protein [bacterium]
MQLKRYVLLLLVLAIAGTIAISAEPPEPKPFMEVLNGSQALYMQWTEEQFANFLDNSEFATLTDSTKMELENIWIEQLKKPMTAKYYNAINCLATIKSKKAVQPLLVIATDRKDKDNRDRWMAVRALGIIGDISVVPELIPLLYHYNSNTRFWAQISLCRLTGVNYGVDWQQWAVWWNKNKPESMPVFAYVTPVVWTTKPEWADWTDPKKQIESDRELIEKLKEKMKKPDTAK